MRHITEYSTERGHAFNGFRVQMQKKWMNFTKYVSCKGRTREEALEEAMEIERDLRYSLAECKTGNDILKLYKEWKKK